LINLARRQDRLHKMREQLNNLGIGFQRVEAIDAHTVDDTLLSSRFSENGPLGPLPKGDKCCTLSHERAWHDFLASGARYGMMLEDDVELSNDAATLLGDDSWIPDHVGLLKVERFGPAHQRVLIGDYRVVVGGRQIGRLRSRHTGGGAYILSRTTAAELLNPGRVWTLPVDHALFNPNNSPLFESLKPYQLTPVIARQSEAIGGATDIDEWRESFRHMSLTRFKGKVVRSYYDLRLLPKQVFSLATGTGRLVRVEAPKLH